MTIFHLLKIRTSKDIFKNEKCKVTFGLEYIKMPAINKKKIFFFFFFFFFFFLHFFFLQIKTVGRPPFRRGRRG